VKRLESSGKPSWLNRLRSLKSAIDGVASDKQQWDGRAFVAQTLARVCDDFKKDLDSLQKDANFIFAESAQSDSPTQKSVDLLRQWQLDGRGPSLAALSVFALQNFGLKGPENYIDAVLIAGVLGEVENNISYHNNMHYRKVLFNTLRLVAAHNHIYRDTPRAFTDRHIALLIVAACIHDLGHDGRGNTIKGVFHQGRLEKRACDLAKPYLQSVGLTDERDLADLRVLLLCTEVTPLDDAGNPMNQMKAAYRYHYLGDNTKTHTLNLDTDLAALQVDEDLTMMSLILHEADIATSAGYTYAVTKYETCLYMGEITTKAARPQHVIDFIHQICQRKFLSDAAQKLYASNLARIYALAEADVEAGDELYPPPEESDFLNEDAKGNKIYLKTV
jgi:hypothetical protein